MMHVLVSFLLCIQLMSGLTMALTEDANMSFCNEEERRALLDVKTDVIDPHGNLNDWASEGEKMDCCKWAGVICNNHTGRVIELDLTFNSSGLRGKISPSFQVLNHLQYLNLSGINFQTNPLPNILGSLSRLRVMDISSANISGHIPHQLANLSDLLRLDLSRNLLQGSIPFSFGNLTSLTYLDLSQNQLQGDIPKSLGNCLSLLQLDLSQNHLKGSIPDSMGQLSNLEYLDFAHNSLNGIISNGLGQASNLRFLDVSSNSLQGVISQVHLLNITHLHYLDLSFNSLALDLNDVNGEISFQLSTIKLQSCNLGPRFPMWIRTQRDFRHLDISSAGISDNIPAWFFDLPAGLEFLNISSNQIKGTLPNIMSSFLGYVAMDLSNNRFEGRVPLLPSKLAALNLSRNKFSGTLSFLCVIDGFIGFLDLSNNFFSGSLPDCWKNRVILRVVNLSNNNLLGEIPSSLGNLFLVEALYLRANAFVGELPVSLGNCTRLRFLDLGKNKLSGAIPEWIGEKLSKLYVLVLGSNRFYGSLPSQVCWLSNLQVLDLSNNGLSGDIPRCVNNFTAMAKRSFGDDMTNHSYLSYIPVLQHPSTNIPSSENIISERDYFLDNALVTWKGKERSFERSGLQLLKTIDLSRNNLSGILPYEITSLIDLASLNLSTNKLHGEVPKDTGRLKSLQSLDLSRNEFFGHIPWSLSQLNFLSVLDLSNNNLSGRIPTGPQLQLFDSTSYSGNPQLCGPPLTPRCGLPPVVREKDVEEDEDDLWKSFYTGMGVGFAVGFSGICCALFFNRRFRYVFFAWLSSMKDWIYVMVVVHFGKLVRKFRK